MNLRTLKKINSLTCTTCGKRTDQNNSNNYNEIYRIIKSKNRQWVMESDLEKYYKYLTKN